MTKFRDGITEGFINLNLAGGIVEMVASSYDMSDPHRGIVHHHRKIISGESVTSQDDEVIQFGIVKFHPSLNEVLHDRLPLIWGKKTDGRGYPGRNGFSMETRSIVFGFDPSLQGGFPL